MFVHRRCKARLVEPEQNVRKNLPISYCANLDEHGLKGDMTKMNTFTSPGNTVQFQLLNNVSKFYLQANLSTPTHEATPYLTAVFAGNDHGSWVDILLQIASTDADTNRSTQFQQPYLSETLQLQQFQILKRIERKLDNFVWFHLDLNNPHDTLSLVLWLETVLPDARFFEINQIEWGEEVALSEAKTSLCVSLAGLVSGGRVKLPGQQGFLGVVWQCLFGDLRRLRCFRRAQVFSDLNRAT